MIYRGDYYAPLFYGGNETPAYRRSSGLGDRGVIITAWPDSRIFRSRAERDEACVADAAAEAQDDPTRAEALAFVREASERAIKGAARRVRDQARPAREEHVPAA